MGILDFFAERDGDVEARIALRMRDLSSPWDYLQLAEFCLSQGRQDEALRRAEEGTGSSRTIGQMSDYCSLRQSY